MMNLDNGNDLISGGEKLDFRLQGTELDPRKLEEIKALLTADLRPVHALPSDGKLIGLFCLFFAVFCALAAWPVRYFGLQALSASRMGIYFGAIGAGTILCSMALAQEMIPGSRRRINLFAAVAITLAGLIATALILFPDFDSIHFVHRGFGCLRFGATCGLGCGLLLALLLRRGSFTSPFKGAVAAGLFAGLAGVAALAMHCSLLTAPHILVWHFGVLLMGLIVGAGTGELLALLSPKSKKIFP